LNESEDRIDGTQTDNADDQRIEATSRPSVAWPKDSENEEGHRNLTECDCHNTEWLSYPIDPNEGALLSGGQVVDMPATTMARVDRPDYREGY